ncbi:MAG: DNA recombination protein RmuC [Thermodesulfovibrionales bacterium]|nr:DNA recombination protein RmuC [Thermodesulfovibrionales bacterium]MDP3112435.1 DNA recombination protein RmuC [Thermodesulfovibrionales bacterium]
MTTIGFLISGLIIGGIVAWLIASSRAKSSEAVNNELRQQIQQKDDAIKKIRAELDAERELKAKLEESQKHLKEEIERFETIKEELSKTFSSISLDALSKNSAEFLKLAEEKLKSQTIESKKELEGKKELIDQSVETIAKTLTEMQHKLSEVEKGSVKISTLVEHHADITSKLKDTTEHLKQALASSKKRGEWGERMAEDILRLVGLVEGINYIKQKTLEGSSGRPDYTFFLPNSLKINMDVKFPLENYQNYLDAQTEHDKKRFKEELIRNTKTMIKQVTNRAYIDTADNTVDYVIVFIPNEQVYGFVNEADPTIMDEALKQKVILCSPFTLYAVLAVIRQAVGNFNLERTASEILMLLGEFSKQWGLYKERFEAMGKRLDDAKKEFDLLVTTRSNMLDRPLKKIDDLRKQKAIALDENMDSDKPSLLE